MAAKKLPDQSYLRQCLDYDEKTGVLTWKTRPLSHFLKRSSWKRWNNRYPGQTVGYSHKNAKYSTAFSTTIDGVVFLCHRLIWKLVHDEDPIEIDHRNGVNTDNWLDNLRPADRPTNGKNRKSTRGRLLPKGVKKGNRKTVDSWVAYIKNDGALHHLGTFDSPEEAHAAYREAATRLHGEFANFGEDRQGTSPETP